MATTLPALLSSTSRQSWVKPRQEHPSVVHMTRAKMAANSGEYALAFHHLHEALFGPGMKPEGAKARLYAVWRVICRDYQKRADALNVEHHNYLIDAARLLKQGEALSEEVTDHFLGWNAGASRLAYNLGMARAYVKQMLEDMCEIDSHNLQALEGILRED